MLHAQQNDERSAERAGIKTDWQRMTACSYVSFQELKGARQRVRQTVNERIGLKFPVDRSADH
jgi:hypothetical protein